LHSTQLPESVRYLGTFHLAKNVCGTYQNNVQHNCSKYAMKSCVKIIPPHLKRVATLPCEICGTCLAHSSQWPGQVGIHHSRDSDSQPCTLHRKHMPYTRGYRDGFDKTLRTLVSSPSSEWASCREQGHAGSKTLLQQNPLVLNWRYRLMQIVLYTAV